MDYGDPAVRPTQQSVTIATGVATVPYLTPVVLLIGEGAASVDAQTIIGFHCHALLFRRHGAFCAQGAGCRDVHIQ